MVALSVVGRIAFARQVGDIPLKTQLNAIIRKNALYQRRRICLNSCIIILPIFFIGLLYALQAVIDDLVVTRDNQVGCSLMEFFKSVRCVM